MPNSNSNKEKSLDFGQGFYFKNCRSSYRFLRIKRLFCRYDVYVNSLLLIKSTVHRNVNVVGGCKRFVGNINLLRRVCSRRETEPGRN